MISLIFLNVIKLCFTCPIFEYSILHIGTQTNNQPFPSYRHFRTPLQQTTFENIVTKLLIMSHLLSHTKSFKPFPTCRLFLMPLQQMIFENIVTKGEIAQNEQFLRSPQCIQPFSVIIYLHF